MTEEFVYVIGTPGANTVKIGRSIDVARRLADIQRMSPVPLTVLWSTPGGHELETALHRHFRPYRSHGEWFTFHRDPATLIRWAVEEEPWNRPKVTLRKAVKPAPLPPRPAPMPLPGRDDPLDEKTRELLESFFASLRAIDDPVERYHEANRRAEDLRKEIRAQERYIAGELKNQGRTWREVGAALGGVSAQRAHQLAMSPTGR
ncbi:GIY-YIG nuclease family protein [Streptomyces xiamenensis]|uniref:GIY-YIG nuclease family protein n=1 Tax=Streptomyces xiamenensis TaxID=408015 RepID=UPI0037D53FD1